MAKECRRFTEKEKRDIRKWAKKHGAIFTVKEHNIMLKRVLKGCK
jgi:hypothetical protein